VRLRIFTEPQQGASYDDLLTVARATEDLGFDAFFRSDHYLTIGGDGLPGPTDAWVTLAGLARETSRIGLGTLMTAATFRLPGPLAIQVATVDAMSGGRVELGIGAAWYAEEHVAYGIPFPEPHERFDRLEEQLAVITGLWATPLGSRFTYNGGQYSLTESPALPKPFENRRPPIIIGGGGPRRTPQLAARYADDFNAGFRTEADTARLFDGVRRACAEEGRTRPITYSVARTVLCGRDDAEVARRAAAVGRNPSTAKANSFVGTPAEVVDTLGRLAELGTTTAYLQVLDLHDLDHLDLLASAVLPQVGS
jgi:F420-dependent oxidoreductase-like protein